mgnify:FL=1
MIKDRNKVYKGMTHNGQEVVGFLDEEEMESPAGLKFTRFGIIPFIPFRNYLVDPETIDFVCYLREPEEGFDET